MATVATATLTLTADELELIYEALHSHRSSLLAAPGINTLSEEWQKVWRDYIVETVERVDALATRVHATDVVEVG